MTVYVCSYACISTCIYIYMQADTYIHTCACVYVYVHLQVYAHVCVCVYVCMRVMLCYVIYVMYGMVWYGMVWYGMHVCMYV